MYFQAVTPPSRPKKAKKTTPTATSTAPEIITILIAPFTPNPKVLFENVPVQTTATRQVVVRNPNNHDIEVNITKLPLPEQVTFNWTKITILANHEEILNIQWIPVQESTCIDTVSFEGGPRLKKDMQIVFKSVNTKKRPKPKRPGTKKSPTSVVLKRLQPPIKSMTTKKTSNKENESCISGIQGFTSPSSVTFNISGHGQFGRETYLVDNPKIIENNVKMIETPLIYLNANKGFSPKQCSTGKKSKHFLTPEICINNVSTETYVVDNDLRNISSETYVKNISDRNLSTGTYVQLNVSDIAEDSLESKTTNSFEDSLKALKMLDQESIGRQSNQQENHIFDSSLNKYLNLQGSSVKLAVEANLLSNPKWKDNINSKSEDLLYDPRRPRASNSANRKRKSDTVFTDSPFKKLNKSFEIKTFSKVGVPRKIFKLPTQRPTVKKLFKAQKEETELIKKVQEVATISHNTTQFLSAISALNSTSSALNPFVTTTYIYDPEWLDEQEACFKRWFNVLLVPHAELKTYSESVDVARIWHQCQRKEVTRAPTKEEVSQEYHVSTRLDSLRKAAMELYQSPDIAVVLRKVLNYVEAGRLEIRSDRNVHQDISLQYEVTRLFLSYNSLWLRIGLETIFGLTIPLQSNSDSIGLTLFIKDCVFKDNYLLRKHKTTLSPKYCSDIKKHILNKFLSFVFFVDHAKVRKLIPHDPCLFVKSAEFKESREILLHFAKEVVASIGDITRFLKPARYVLTYKQTYIHEFDYAVAHLGGDLRDGVRLAKVTEIILLQSGLSEMLRLPAISRLQKIHNVKVSFDALEKAGFRIMEDITPVDIVNGHKEKTLTFLWQIVNKFQVPRYTKGVVTIQNWFRSLNIMIKRKTLAKKWLKKEEAARVIQSWYRKYLYSRISFKERRHVAALKIQSHFKMWQCRATYLKTRQCIIMVQSKYRAIVAKQKAQKKLYSIIKLQAFIRGYLQKKRFINLKAAVMTVEKLFIARKRMLECRAYYKTLKTTVLLIENKFIAMRTMRVVRKEFLGQKQAALTIKSYIQMHKTRNAYLSLKNAAICIQQRFRAQKLMQQHNNYFNELRIATISIQHLWRATQAMKQQRADYLHRRNSIIIIQRYYKSYLNMKLAKSNYLTTRNTIIVIQRKFRANRARYVARKEYLSICGAVETIQNRLRAHWQMLKQRQLFIALRKSTVNIQNLYRAQKSMRKERSYYLLLKKYTIKLQMRFRANKLAKRTLEKYKKVRQSVIYIQRKFRATLMMRIEREKFQDLKDATIIIQRRLRATMSMREHRLTFLQFVYCAEVIQNYYRSYKLTLHIREEFCNLRLSVLNIQRRFRANKLMKHRRSEYRCLLKAVKYVQHRYRVLLEMRKERNHYIALKNVAERLQSRYRARKAMQLERVRYLQLKQLTLSMQRRYRAKILMREQLSSYQRTRNNIINIQRYYRSYKQTQKIRNDYCLLRKSVINMQRRIRAQQLMKKQQAKYLLLLDATKSIQQRYRATIQMRKERNDYLALMNATKLLQSRYKAQIAMRIQLKQFQYMKKCVMLIQRKYRATMLMKQQRATYLILQSSVVTIQRYYKSYRLAVATRNDYCELKIAVVTMQSRIRANLLMKNQRSKYLRLVENVKIIQERYRAYLKMRCDRERYVALKNITNTLQSKYRARKAMRIQLEQFQHLKKCTVLIQRKYKATVLMKQQRINYLRTLNSIINIQRFYRSYKLTHNIRANFCQLKRSAIFIQRRFRDSVLITKQRKAATYIQQRFRAQIKMRLERQSYIQTRNASIKIQCYYRSFKKMQTARNNYCLLKTSTVIIQRFFLAYQSMKKQRVVYLQSLDAVRTVQQKYRAQLKMRSERDRYNALKAVTRKLQSKYRATKSMKTERELFLQLKQICMFIQRRFRANKMMHQERNKYLLLKKYVLYIETKQEAKLLSRKEVEKYQLLRRTIIGIQTYARGYLARKKYAYIFDEEYRLQRKEEMRQEAAAKKIQAVWRGFRTRSDKNNDVQQIQKSRQQRKLSNKAAVPTLTLGEKHQDLLQGIARNSLMKIIFALKDLDYIARHSKKSCESLCALLPDFLYGTTVASTRSVSDMEAIEVATHLIITLYKFSPDDNTYQAQHLDRMLTLMNHYCDKESRVFLNIATLFWLFAQNKRRRRDILAIPNLRRRLLKLKELTERKIKMSAKGVRSQQSVFAACSVTSQAYLPYMQPDWGLEYAHRPHAFTNIKHALQVLLETLDTF